MASGSTILITGSSGLIGTNLGIALCRCGINVVGIDVRENIWTDMIPTLRCDLSDPGSFYLLSESTSELKDVGLVVHLAAHPKVHNSVQQPERSCNDIVAAHTILEFCRRHMLPLIFASSREVYGNEGTTPQTEAQADHHRAASPYAAGKIAVEALIYSYSRCFGVPGLVFRLSNVYGRFDADLDRMERVVPLFIETVARGDEVTVFGNGKVLDFTWIDDCIDALLRGIDLMREGYPGGHALNVGTGRGHTLVELAELVATTLGTSARVRMEPSRTGEVCHYVADISHARSLLGYNPRTDLPEGVQQAVRWWKGVTQSAESHR